MVSSFLFRSSSSPWPSAGSCIPCRFRGISKLDESRISKPKFFSAAVCVFTTILALQVPKLWDQKEIAGYRLPLAGLGHAPKLISEQEYYKLPEVNLKTYPVYTPDKEPAGYLEWLQKQDP